MFVLDEEIRFSNNKELPTTKCIDRECYPKPEYKNNSTELLGWRETVMFNGNCTEVRSSAECEGDNMVVLVNPFGKGIILRKYLYQLLLERVYRNSLDISLNDSSIFSFKASVDAKTNS